LFDYSKLYKLKYSKRRLSRIYDLKKAAKLDGYLLLKSAVQRVLLFDFYNFFLFVFDIIFDFLEINFFVD
jgi:hypothetical protein